jgi:hypothetical protein
MTYFYIRAKYDNSSWTAVEYLTAVVVFYNYKSGKSTHAQV